jgi:hypothetical protein
VDDSIGCLFITGEQVNAPLLAMETIIAFFEPDVQKDEEGSRQPDCQACYIQRGITAMPPKTSESDFEIIFEHGWAVMDGCAMDLVGNFNFILSNIHYGLTQSINSVLSVQVIDFIKFSLLNPLYLAIIS